MYSDHIKYTPLYNGLKRNAPNPKMIVRKK